MKIIWNDTRDGTKMMFDTNSFTIREKRRDLTEEGYFLEYIDGSSEWGFYKGRGHKVREMFDAIIAAEKRGDKFFEITY